MAEERARQEIELMERSLGFADDSVLIHDISSDVFEQSHASSTGRLEFTNSISDTMEWSFGEGRRERLISGTNVAGVRFEKGIGLGQVSDGLIEIKPVCDIGFVYNDHLKTP